MTLASLEGRTMRIDAICLDSRLWRSTMLMRGLRQLPSGAFASTYLVRVRVRVRVGVRVGKGRLESTLRMARLRSLLIG